MNHSAKLLISAFIFLVISIGLNAQNSTKILDDLSKKTNSYSNIKATFSYKMLNAKAGINEITNGTLLVTGNKYHLSIAGQEVISDGATVWTLLPESNEVQINSVTEESGFSPSKLLANYNVDYNSKLENDITKDGKSCYQIKLTPKQKNSNFNYVILIVNKELLQLASFVIYDFDDNVFTYDIKQFTTNSSLPADSFIFNEKNYPGIEVIDLR
jgi:outer membrane lipoprotein-sorting protein